MNRPILSSSRGREQASAFILVLWIATGLVSVALLFGSSMLFQYRIADNTTMGYQSDQTVQGALQYATYVLSSLEKPGMLPEEGAYAYEEVPLGDFYFWFLNRPPEQTQTQTVVYGLIDEASKLNLNTATQEMLEGLPNMTPELAAAIIDWRDEDEDVTDGGAESQVYLMNDPPYNCKNAPFGSIFELRLVYGFTDELLFGEDSNLNGLLDPNENDGVASHPNDNQNGVLEPGILNYVTVFSKEPTTDADGEARINITSTEDDSLSELLQEILGEERGNQVGQNAGEDVGSLLEFYMGSGMTAEEWDQVEDHLTVSDEAAEGLVNINTASAEVLACLPGMDESLAQQILAARQADPTLLNSLAWVTTVLDETVAAEVGPYITSRSYQCLADIVSVRQDSKGYRRSWFVIDTSGEEPVIRYRMDFTGFGWALPEEVRTSLTMAQAQENKR
ncbi:MAG: type II secretion system protein GspK [bacterium]|jgi:DNA uptake protein ComE-like DNA-binding protein|nr:type II secretion system protein GspK [bacterium]